MKGKLTIPKLIIAGFGLAVLFISVVGLGTVLRTGSHITLVTTILSKNAPFIMLLDEIGNNMLMHRRYEKDFILNIGKADKQAQYLDKFGKQHQSMLDLLGKLDTLAAQDQTFTEQDRRQLTILASSYAAYHDGILKLCGTLGNDPSITPQQGNVLAGDSKQDIHAFEEQLAALSVTARNRFEETAARGINETNTLRTVLTIVFVCGVALMIGVGIAIYRAITIPLNLAAGDLDESSEQVAFVAERIASGSQDLADGSSQQAAAIEQTSASLEELASMTRQNATNASEADKLMQETSTIVDRANLSMGELTDSMREISQASEETSKIVKTIDEIAFQTNLLALNAAVEAARAGEAGAGFAVVADEVRNLAMRAAVAAKDTANLIEGTVKRVQSGTELVDRTSQEFSEVATNTTKAGTLVSEITAASNEQALGIEQTSKAMGEMDSVVQRTAGNAQEAAGSSEGLKAQTAIMGGVIDNLQALIGGDIKTRLPRQTIAAGRKIDPCWIAKECPKDRMEECPAHPGLGDSCWMVTGTKCGGETQGSYHEKMEGCRRCDFYIMAHGGKNGRQTLLPMA